MGPGRSGLVGAALVLVSLAPVAGCRCSEGPLEAPTAEPTVDPVEAPASSPSSPRASSKTATSEPAPGWTRIPFGPAASPRHLVDVFAPVRGDDVPITIALHGRGEAERGPVVGASAWREDYGVERVHEALLDPPLEPSDVGGFATAARLGAIHTQLEETPYRGVILACPDAPALSDRTLEGARDYCRFLTDELLPAVRTEAGSERSPATIDGVSMGGRLALFCGILHPETFDAVGALQPAIAVGEAEGLADAIRKAIADDPFALRLVSSEDDPFLEAVRALSSELRQRGVDHEFVVTPGPHNYAWNRGPGSLELLFWHDRQRG